MNDKEKATEIPKQEPQIRWDCFAHHVIMGKHHCTALNAVYCQFEECKFYKSRIEYQAELKRLYGE